MAKQVRPKRDDLFDKVQPQDAIDKMYFYVYQCTTWVSILESVYMVPLLCNFEPENLLIYYVYDIKYVYICSNKFRNLKKL